MSATADKLCAQQTVILLSEKPAGFFDSLSSIPFGVLLLFYISLSL